jgi:hypothetical protein
VDCGGAARQCHNLFIQTVFDNLMRNTGKTLWYTTEFGVALAVVNVVVAIYFWTRRKEVEQQALPASPLMGRLERESV